MNGSTSKNDIGLARLDRFLTEVGPGWRYHSFARMLKELLGALTEAFRANTADPSSDIKGSVWVPRYSASSSDDIYSQPPPLQMAYTTFAATDVAPYFEEPTNRMGQTIARPASRVGFCYSNAICLYYPTLSECEPTSIWSRRTLPPVSASMRFAI